MRQVEVKDIEYKGFIGGRSGGRRRTRQSRALDTSEFTFTFEHVPTGTQVKVSTGPVHWSRKEVQARIEAIRRTQAKELIEKELTRK